MELIQDKSTAIIPEGEYDVASNTVLRRGQVVVLTDGKVTAADASQSGAILGICLENHTGEASYLDPRANGVRIRVADGPNTIFACPAPVITATGGSTTTVADTALATFADDAFNGGVLKLLARAASSTNSGAIGTVYGISDYTGTSKTFTLDETLAGAVAAGDQYEVYPPIGSSLGSLDTNRDRLTLGSAASDFALKVVGHDVPNGRIYLMAKIHIYASSAE